MRILLLTQWFDPEPTFKGLLFAQELQKHGHDVQVLTGFPNYPGGRLYDGYDLRPMKREVIGGVRVLRVALYPSHDNSAIHRVLNYVSFAGLATVGALLVRRPDVAYIYHPPATVGVPALALKQVRGVPFVYDVQDLWPDTLAATGMLTDGRILRTVDVWMRVIYRASARVVVLSRGFQDAIESRGTPRQKIEVIHNWADENRIKPADPGPVRAKELGFDGKFNVVFAGNMGRAQALTTVLDAADLLRDEPKVQFVLVGGGVEVDSLKAEASRRQLANVIFLPYRPIEEMGEILALADALLVHLKDDKLFEITVPGKTQVYLMAEKPILMGVRGDAAALVQEADAGVVFEPQHPDQLAAGVLALQAMTVDDRKRLGFNGAQFYRDKLSLDIGVSKFLNVLAEAALTKPRLSAAKRVLDIVTAAVALIFLSIPMALLAILIRQKLGSPVLLRQTRPGQYGQPFEMVTFRRLTDARDESGCLPPDRRRFTPFGAKLRLSSLDELPRLWNVLRGHMSLVGPSPLLMRHTQHFTNEERLRLLVRPGISGWAQVNGRSTTSWSERLAMDVWYVRNRSLRLDANIAVMTLGRLFRRSGVVIDPESVMQDLDDERRDSVSAH